MISQFRILKTILKLSIELSVKCNFNTIVLFLLTVDGVELGRKMNEDDTTDVAGLLVKPNDSEEVKEIKKLITDMLSRDPDKRPRIGEVVDRLSQLRTSLGVQVLMAVDTVWATSVCYSKSNTFQLFVKSLF